MSASALTTPSVPPRLPPELIDEILRENELSNSDLAQCCLVSHQFLPLARRSLYNKVRVLMKFRHYWNSTFGWNYLNSTCKLRRTLEENPSLRKLCHGLCLEERPKTAKTAVEKLKEARDPEEVTREWLDLLPTVRNLSLDQYLPSLLESNDSLTCLRQQKTISLRLKSPSLPLSASIQACGVKRLKVEADSYRFLHSWGEAEKLNVPNSVITLDIGVDSRYNLRVTPDSHLQNLQINGASLQATELSQFSQLRYLSIVSFLEDDLVSSPGLSGLHCLCRLSLTFEDYGAVEQYQLYSDTIQFLLSHLPPSLCRLDFRDSTPFDDLTSILRFIDDLPITELGISEKVISDPDKKQEIDLLKGLCEERGIGIYHLEEKDAIFDF